MGPSARGSANPRQPREHSLDSNDQWAVEKGPEEEFEEPGIVFHAGRAGKDSPNRSKIDLGCSSLNPADSLLKNLNDNKADKRRGCSSLDMRYQSAAANQAVVEKLNLPVFLQKNRDGSTNKHNTSLQHNSSGLQGGSNILNSINNRPNQGPFDFSLGSAKKTFTQQSTVTGNKALSTLEEQRSTKNITERLAELFARIEKEEGESEEVSNLKKEITMGMKLSKEGPKTCLNFYRILKLLGKGSFGKVYMASQVLTNRVVAIKCLDKKVMKEESRKNKIMHELLMFKSLAGHPNVIQIYEVFENRKYYFFVMEYASGGDLLHLMKKKARLSETQARGIFIQLVRGLRFIHSKKILHRDIKLDNILLSEHEGELRAKICDFGVSRTINDGETINEQCGTPAYIAPEIIRKKGYKGFSADIWSLGVLLYAMVMGAMPFKANDIEGLHQKIKDRDCDMSDEKASKEVKDLIERMLCLDPDQRITLDGIINHPWLKDDPKQQTIKEDAHDWITAPEEFVVHKIVRYGFPLDHVITSIQNYLLNHAFACYMTLTKDFQ